MIELYRTWTGFTDPTEYRVRAYVRAGELKTETLSYGRASTQSPLFTSHTSAAGIRGATGSAALVAAGAIASFSAAVAAAAPVSPIS